MRLGVGPGPHPSKGPLNFRYFLSVMPFAQWDIANDAAFSWGGMLVFDFKVLQDLGVPLVK